MAISREVSTQNVLATTITVENTQENLLFGNTTMQGLGTMTMMDQVSLSNAIRPSGNMNSLMVQALE